MAKQPIVQTKVDDSLDGLEVHKDVTENIYLSDVLDDNFASSESIIEN